MKYNIATGVQRSKHNLRKIVIGATASLAIAGAAAFPALAANDYCGFDSTGPGNGPVNGCEHSQANTPCAGHGAFGAFGKDNNFAGGASGDRTAYANSTLCGNPQGSAGVLGDHPN
jgi:hypothetical protein